MNAFVLPYAPSEREGFIPERLERLTAAMQRQIDEKKAPGASMLIARHGKLVYRQCLGALRPDGPPMSEDAIFRIYSMTKPIVSVAAMMLVEQGRLSIIDPVSAYIPAFADVKVGVANGDRLELVPPRRPVTVQDLMRHTSGLTYGFTGGSPVQKLTKAADLRNPNRTIAETVEKIAALAASCISRARSWEYSLSTDVLGRVVEIVEGARLSEVLRERIFDPLGMNDTAFFTPESKLARRADPFSFDFMTTAGVDSCNATASAEVSNPAAAACCRRLPTTRALLRCSAPAACSRACAFSARATLAFMASDHLAANVRRDHYLLWPGHGFGLGFAVRTRPRPRADGRERRRVLLGRHDGNRLLGLAAGFPVRDSHASDAGIP